MSREVRITIDDDEVFERMRRRKDELDLSWEEVLRRGLSEADDGPGRGTGQGRGPRQGHPGPGGPGESGAFGSRGHGPGGWNPFDPEFGRKLGEYVRRSIRESVPFEGEFGPGGLEAEIGRIEDAEDAVLAFPFLGDDPEHQVPLRVTLATSTEGLDVTVVAVRRGKDVASMNRFDADARATVTRELAAGESAVLRLQDGAEEYEVAPLLEWSRDEYGRPTVAEVEIESVQVGE